MPTGSRNKNSHFNVYHGTLNGLQILYSAEIDGIKWNGNPDDMKLDDLNEFEYVEIKTKFRFPNDDRKLDLYFRYWVQCVLANVKWLLIGPRDNDGNINGMHIRPFEEFPKQKNREVSIRFNI